MDRLLEPDLLGSRIRGRNMVRDGYVVILFVAWMRPLLERLLLTYAVCAIFTLLMQTCPSSEILRQEAA